MATVHKDYDSDCVKLLKPDVSENEEQLKN